MKLSTPDFSGIDLMRDPLVDLEYADDIFPFGEDLDKIQSSDHIKEQCEHDKTVYLIQNLKPGTTYKIEVKAVSLFEGIEMKSHPATLYISTIQIPSQQTEAVLTIPIILPTVQTKMTCSSKIKDRIRTALLTAEV
ncbi:unnamed protein product [Schistosoma mattheei]|uniref:Uncharacterized protein n=1 Tax=Schistosoma mattheei TaxID=31246 RepID=A0A183PFU8_9TREM|nr:unnamed protein product [Schistosoma mattheei]